MIPQVIAHKVAEELGFSFQEVISESRLAHLVECRRWIALILYDRCFTVPMIAEILQKNRTTIIYQLEVIRSFVSIYPQYKKKYQELTRIINENQAD